MAEVRIIGSTARQSTVRTAAPKRRAYGGCPTTSVHRARQMPLILRVCLELDLEIEEVIDFLRERTPVTFNVHKSLRATEGSTPRG